MTMRKFKINNRDKYLFAGFVICCILVAWMAWQISDPTVTSRGSCIYYMLCLFGG
jgi:hypothetical protein